MVDTHISDLFFNSNLDEAKDKDGNYDPDLLNEQASEFLDHLEALGVDTPDAEDLTADFLNRL